MFYQVIGGKAQVQLEVGAIQHVLPEVECVGVVCSEVAALPVFRLGEESLALGCWQRSSACEADERGP